MNNFFESIKNVFTAFPTDWGTYAVELVAFFLLFSFVFRILKEGSEPHLIVAYSLLVLFGGGLCIVSKNFDTAGYFIYLR